jgi:hypothetical protein
MLHNGGDADLPARYTVSIYASTRRTLYRRAVLLGRVVIQRPLKTASFAYLRVPIEIPASLAAGQYHLVAFVGAGDAQIAVASSGGTFAVK